MGDLQPVGEHRSLVPVSGCGLRPSVGSSPTSVSTDQTNELNEVSLENMWRSELT